MKNLFSLAFVLFVGSRIEGQTRVSGMIRNIRHEPISSASVVLKESGASVFADSVGHFYLLTSERGKRTILVSSIGYNDREQSIVIGDLAIKLEIVLREEAKQLGEVVVSAGSFEANDKAKGASLTPMDAVTVAGSGADIANSLRSLPGSQQVGEREGLFVRGGTSEEAKQFVDGTLLKNPNFSPVPGQMQPARLNPFLFKGILFNTGAYSALYGDALQYVKLALAIDASNPRALYLDGWEKYSTPKAWGGDKVKAKQSLEKAKDILAAATIDGIGPHWGAKEVQELLSKL